MRKCGDQRPENRAEEKKVEQKKFKLDDLGEMSIALTVFPGCIEGDRLNYSVRGDDRAVLAYGTAGEITAYTVGESVTLSGKDVPEELRKNKYKRNVSRKQEEAVQRIRNEMTGTGDIAELVKKKEGKYDGFTLQVNGERVSQDSVLNSYFQAMTFVQGVILDPQTGTVTSIKKSEADKRQEGDFKPYAKAVAQVTAEDVPFLQQGKEVRFMGGVELVVSAVIVPGKPDFYQVKR